MDRAAVSSSNVRAIGYDSATQTLEVEFVNGSVYQYYSVPENMYEAFLKASSKGQFLHQYIRNAYPYSRTE